MTKDGVFVKRAERPDWPLADALNTLSRANAPSALRVTRKDGSSVFGVCAGADATRVALASADALEPIEVAASDILRIEERTFARGRRVIVWGTLGISVTVMAAGFLVPRHEPVALIAVGVFAIGYVIMRRSLYGAVARWWDGDWASSWRVLHDARYGP